MNHLLHCPVRVEIFDLTKPNKPPRQCGIIAASTFGGREICRVPHYRDLFFILSQSTAMNESGTRWLRRTDCSDDPPFDPWVNPKLRQSHIDHLLTLDLPDDIRQILGDASDRPSSSRTDPNPSP